MHCSGKVFRQFYLYQVEKLSIRKPKNLVTPSPTRWGGLSWCNARVLGAVPYLLAVSSQLHGVGLEWLDKVQGGCSHRTGSRDVEGYGICSLCHENPHPFTGGPHCCHRQHDMPGFGGADEPAKTAKQRCCLPKLWSATQNLSLQSSVKSETSPQSLALCKPHSKVSRKAVAPLLTEAIKLQLDHITMMPYLWLSFLDPPWAAQHHVSWVASQHGPFQS